ncbi:MAG: hypothetical protein AB9842_03945 [Bacteroidales bacterium]
MPAVKKTVLLRLFVLIGFQVLCLDSMSQEIPLEKTITERIQAYQLHQNLSVHSSFKPLLIEQFKVTELDPILYPARNTQFARTLTGRKLFNENLIHIDTGGFMMQLDPLFNLSLGKDISTLWVNSRGFTLSGKIGSDFCFGTQLYETQAVFPEYIDEWVEITGVAPGQGPVKDFKTKGYDFTNVSGYISYTPSRYFNFRLGHGKNFIGEGYRSLLLSDNAFNYPYLKITTTVWKLQYTNLYAQFMDRQEPWSTSYGFNRKYGTFHFLSADITKRLNVGLFEAVIWEAADSTGSRGFDVQYLNPIIFYRPVEYSMGSPDNALLGMNIKYRVSKSLLAYGQVMLDDFKLEHVKKQDGWWANKQGFQLGLAGYSVFKVSKLNFRTEFNYVRPYTYSHWSSLQCYGQYNQPLAHPYGANFSEFIAQISYATGFWYFSYQHIHAMYGLDTAGINYGKNIFLSYTTHPYEFDNKTGQGLKTTLIRNDFLVAWIINPRTNLRVEAGLSFRTESSELWKKNNTIYWLGLHTSLRNLYYDF